MNHNRSEVENRSYTIINLIKDQLHKIKIKKAYWLVIVFMTLSVMVGALIFGIINHRSHSISTTILLQNKRILHEMNSILQDIERNPEHQQVMMLKLGKSIEALQISIGEVAKVADVKAISNQISLVQKDIDYQIDDLKKAVSENHGDKVYLDIAALPFRVISTDVIAGQAYVAVNYADHIMPLSVGDSLSGWHVSSVDYDNNIVEFMNLKNQSVQVNLASGL